MVSYGEGMEAGGGEGGGGTAINGLYRLSRVKEKGVKKGWDEL